MVIHETTIEDQLRRLLAEAQSESVSIGHQIAELQAKWDALKKEADAYSAALQGYLKRTGRQPVVQDDWIEQLRKLPHKEKLVAIAKRSNGEIKISKVADIFYTNKMTESKSRHNTYSMIQVMLTGLAEDGIFERIKPGMFKLVSAQASLPGVN